MSESERRRAYRYNRVLIETARILDPQFADAVVFLSGAQIEMLRNVTQYLNRRDTYVSEQSPGYYLAPTDEDYDSILAIVADMEEVLMGNPNTIWGYKDRWIEYVTEESVGAANTFVDSTPVPEGYVYVLEQWDVRHDGITTKAVTVRYISGSVGINLLDVPALPHWENVYEPARITMKEGDFVRFFVVALQEFKIAELTVSGYKMVVPT